MWKNGRFIYGCSFVVNNIVFTNEKLFTLQKIHSPLCNFKKKEINPLNICLSILFGNAKRCVGNEAFFARLPECRVDILFGVQLNKSGAVSGF